MWETRVNNQAKSKNDEGYLRWFDYIPDNILDCHKLAHRKVIEVWNQKKKNRIEWIDIAKGILIILVVYGHFCQNFAYNTNTIAMIRRFIYAFHIPAFFMLSGIVFNTNCNFSIREFSIRKYKSLLLPGYVGIIVYAVYFGVIEGGSFIRPVLSIKNVIKEFLWMSSAELGFWFLGALFSLSIILYATHKYVKNEIYRMLIAVVLTCCGLACKQLMSDSCNWPFSIIQASASALFFELGFQLKNLIQKPIYCTEIISALISGGGLLCAIKLNPFEYNIGVWNVGVGDMQWYLLSGIAGSIFILGISRLICKMPFIHLKKALIMFGKSSLYIYVYHSILVGYCKDHIISIKNLYLHYLQYIYLYNKDLFLE